MTEQFHSHDEEMLNRYHHNEYQTEYLSIFLTLHYILYANQVFHNPKEIPTLAHFFCLVSIIQNPQNFSYILLHQFYFQQFALLLFFLKDSHSTHIYSHQKGRDYLQYKHNYFLIIYLSFLSFLGYVQLLWAENQAFLRLSFSYLHYKFYDIL